MTVVLNNLIFNTVYDHAVIHAINVSKHSHISCGVILNGELVSVAVCDDIYHAEVSALSKVKERNYCEKGRHNCY